MSFIRSLSSGARALSLTTIAFAEPDTALDEVTVSATKIATPLLDVAATVTVITDEASECRIDRDIKDLVRYEPNVSVRNNVARFAARTGRCSGLATYSHQETGDYLNSGNADADAFKAVLVAGAALR